MCIEFYIAKYPDKTISECRQMLENHKALLKTKQTPNKCCMRVEYWIEKGYTKEEARQKIREGHNFTLEKCIKKYGEIDGPKKYHERQIKWQNSLRQRFMREGHNGIHQSKFANSIITALRSYFPNCDQEFAIDKYSFDFRLNNVLIEFNGDYWHMNPNKYNPLDMNKTSKKTAQEIWESDSKKYDIAESQGYSVLVIWESEFRNDSIATIQKCKQFINENINKVSI